MRGTSSANRWLLLALSTAAYLAGSNANASAGTLLSCDGISTQAGYKYVGTYCVDYSCKFVVRRVFDEYCPYILEL
jgi:hypothetical protein